MNYKYYDGAHLQDEDKKYKLVKKVSTDIDTFFYYVSIYDDEEKHELKNKINELESNLSITQTALDSILEIIGGE